jgi:WD40 repeat protein
VGKSSILEAGLKPRLAGSADGNVQYEVRMKRLEPGQTLLGALTELVGSERTEASPAQKGPQVEQQPTPLLVAILDQVEGVFVRGGAVEWAEFLDGLVSVLGRGAANRPHKILLGFREEYHARVVNDLKSRDVPWHEVCIAPLDRDGIVEVVTGPAVRPGLREKYRLRVEPPQLAEEIANDVAADPQSPVAPTLQLLLTKMYAEAQKRARERHQEEPLFDRELYLTFEKSRLHLDGFVTEQLEAIRELPGDSEAFAAWVKFLAEPKLLLPIENWDDAQRQHARRCWQDVVIESGLLFSVLGEFITDQDTAGQRSLDELRHIFPHQTGILPAIVGRCKDLYLLVEARAADSYRLGHDTLAPLLRRRLAESAYKGQRAVRILANRSPEFADGKQGAPLDEADLATVEAGEDGMRSWTEPERRLVKASQDAWWKIRKRRWIVRFLLAGAVMVIVLAGIYAEWKSYQLDRAIKTNFQQLGLLNWKQGIAARDLNHDPLEAAHYLIKSHYYFDWAEDPSASRASLLAGNILLTWRLIYEYSSNGRVLGTVSSQDEHRLVAWGDDGAVRLWEVGKPDQPAAIFRHVERPDRLGDVDMVGGASFSRDERRLLTWGDKAAKLWEISKPDQPAAIFEHGNKVYGASLSRDEKHVLTWGNGSAVKLWEVGNPQKPAKELQQSFFVPGVRGRVWGASFCRDGRRLLTWGDDNTTKLWELGKLDKPASVFEQPGEEVLGASLGRDGRRLFTWGDGGAFLWNVANAEKPTYTFPHDGLTGAWFSPDGRHVLVWGKGSARLWEVERPDPLADFRRMANVCGALLSRGEKHVLTWDEDGAARLWEVDRPNQPVATFQHGRFTPEGRRRGCGALLSKDEGRLLTWGSDGSAKLWEVGRSDRPAAVLQHGGQVLGASFSRDEKNVITWSDDGTIRLWEVGKAAGTQQVEERLFLTTFRKMAPTFFDFDGQVRGASFSRDKGHLLTWGDDEIIRLWKVNMPDRPVTVFPQGGQNIGASFGWDDKIVLTWGGDEAKLWEVGRHQPATIFPHGRLTPRGTTPVRGASLGQDGQHLFTWGGAGAFLWNVANAEKPTYTFPYDGLVTGAWFSPDERHVLVWGQGTARLWEVGRPDQRSDFQHSWMKGASLSRDEGRLLTWGGDGTAKLWEVGKPGQPTVFQHGLFIPSREVNGASLSRDEGRLLTWGGDGTAKLWEVGKPDQPTAIFRHSIERPDRFGHVDMVGGASLSQDERRLLTWGDNGAAKLWEVGKPDQPAAIFDHGNKVYGASLSRDEKHVLTWDISGIVKLWKVTAHEPIAVVTNGRAIRGASWSNDESRLLTWRGDGILETTDLCTKNYLPRNQNVADNDLGLEVEVQTGTRLDLNGIVVVLSREEWRDHKRQLEKIKGR